jgi:hypothetical protein
MLSGKLRVDNGAPQVVTRSVVGANDADYVGQVGPPAVATADRKDFSGSYVFLVSPGAHSFTMSVTREIGTATNVGFAFGNMQAEVMPFGSGGALAPAALTASLNGANEVDSNGIPNDQGDPDGTGMSMVSLNADTGELCYEISVANIDTPTAAHIHRGAAGVAGPVVVNLTAPSTGSVSGCTSTTPALAAEIAGNPAGFYVNVHNGPFPDGAVRGQLED